MNYLTLHFLFLNFLLNFVQSLSLFIKFKILKKKITLTKKLILKIIKNKKLIKRMQKLIYLPLILTLSSVNSFLLESPSK